MLVLSRGLNESIEIETSDGPILITVTRLSPGSYGGVANARLGIEAPKCCRVNRKEIADRIRRGVVAAPDAYVAGSGRR